MSTNPKNSNATNADAAIRPLTRRSLLAPRAWGSPRWRIQPLFAHEAARAATSRNAVRPLTPRAPHFAPKAKHIIHLFMNGGVSQVDTFDPKPALAKYADRELPTGNLTTERRTGAAFASPFKFSKYGQSGIEVSELFPHAPNTSTTSPSSARWSPTSPITSRRCCS